MVHWSVHLRRLSTVLFWGLLVLAFLASLAIAITSCATGGTHPQPQPTPFDPVAAKAICGRIWREELLRSIDDRASQECVEQQRHDVKEPQLRDQVRSSPEYAEAHKPKPLARPGIVRAAGAVLLDDVGPNTFLGGSLFWAHWGYEHDRARLERNLQWLQDHGHDYVRVILSARWGIVAPDPRSATWEASLAGLVDLVYAHGMRTEITIFGWDDPTPNPAARRKAVEAVARVAAARPQKVMLIEVGNELYQNFPNNAHVPTSAILSEVKDLARLLMAKTRNLVAVTAPSGDSCVEQGRWYGGGAGSIVSLHFARTFAGDGEWRPIRQPWRESRYSCPGVAKAYIDNERIGPATSVKRDSSPLRLGIGVAASFIAGMGAVNLHTGAGISGQQDSSNGGRQSNLWEIPGIEAITKAVNASRRALPADIAGWDKDASRPTRAFSLSSQDWARIDHGRFYCAYRNQQFACAVFAMTGSIRPPAARPMHVRVIHPETGAQLQDLELAKGQALPLSGTPAAVILRGTFR